jgi:hypothetical protein
MTSITKSKRPPCKTIQGSFGVNLFGYSRGELGIGEDLRMVAMALEANDIPFCIVDIKLGKHISQQDDSMEKWVVDKPRYGINLFCQTGMEMARFVSKQGEAVFRDRYTIGLWPWELPKWPKDCENSYAFVDEIWGISSYAANAYSSFPGSVQPMTLPVAVDGIGKETRQDFDLPEQAYLFGFSFDIHSRTSRKNPEGLIKAFQKAFPEEGPDQVGLVLKVNHPKTWCFDWWKIRRKARRDPRIHIIEKTMRRSSLLALYKSFDCFVSLHRAEGFGRGIAEALLLDLQVICTGFSGNMDFCHEPRVALVRSCSRPIKKREYMLSEGQYWAEPDLDHASELMREVRAHPRDSSEKITCFSPKKIGERYFKRLHEIYTWYIPKVLAEAL